MSQGLRPNQKMAKMLYKIKKTPRSLQAQRAEKQVPYRQKYWSFNYMSAQ